MSEFFGISMTHIMIGLLVVLAIALGSVAYVFVRNRIMFQVGVRNIPRRRAQTVLIVLGLMLSTLIITAALGIGDTVDYSITNQVYGRLHGVDELVMASAGSDADNAGDGASGSDFITAQPIPKDQASEIIGRIKEIEGVDGAVKVVRAPVPASSDTQAEPVTVLVGVDGKSMDGFSDIESIDGKQLSVSDLGRDELYADESLADKLDIKAGDQIEIAVGGTPHRFTAKQIVKDRLLSGAVFGLAQGMVMDLSRAQELLGRDSVDFIAVSNDGGPRAGLDHSDSVTKAIDEELKFTDWRAIDIKQQGVDAANETSSFMTTFVTVLGLFSIAAGVMLVFLIFVMLAAERKVEMGMVRAVGTKRSHLVQMFMSEGMVYNVGAALVGVVLGVGVSAILMRFMAMLLDQFDFIITFHVSPRSLVISYSIGVVLTFLTVTFSSWRVGVLNIVSAIRDVPEAPPPRPKPSWGNILSFVYWVFFKARGWRQWLTSLGMVIGGAVLLPVGVMGFFGAAREIYSDASTIRGVVAVLLGISGGFAVFFGAVLALLGLSRIFQIGAMGIVLGVPLMVLGLSSNQLGFWAGGVSLVMLGVALTLVEIGFNSRLIFTTVGIVLLVYWLLGAGDHIPPKNMNANVEMFFLSGVTMVLSGTFVLVYNADLLLYGLTAIGRAVPALVPPIKTAVAYPLANRFRTGMTIAMISLVMFALVMMSTMNSNFDRLFLSDNALAGYDVGVRENPSNPIHDLPAAIEQNGGDSSGIERVDDLNEPNSNADQARNLGDEKFSGAAVVGLTEGFINNSKLTFSARATGFSSDREVLDALASNPDYAVIDSFSIEQGGFGGGGGDDIIVKGIKATDTKFDPVTIEVRNANTGVTKRVTIIGVTDVRASFLFSGLLLTPQTFQQVFGDPERTLHFVRLKPGVNARDEARMIERTLLRQGVEAESLRKIIQDQQALSRGFLYLIQAFMGLGLFVGIAAVGVIAFRTVVERRQQIGMLRAIGYSRRSVALSFLFESSFVTLLGVFSGIVLGLLLAQQLVQTDDFVPGGVDSFYIPWRTIGLIGGFAFLASIIMTIIPSRQASSIPIAEALRYE